MSTKTTRVCDWCKREWTQPTTITFLKVSGMKFNYDPEFCSFICLEAWAHWNETGEGKPKLISNV